MDNLSATDTYVLFILRHLKTEADIGTMTRSLLNIPHWEVIISFFINM